MLIFLCFNLRDVFEGDCQGFFVDEGEDFEELQNEQMHFLFEEGDVVECVVDQFFGYGDDEQFQVLIEDLVLETANLPFFHLVVVDQGRDDVSQKIFCHLFHLFSLLGVEGDFWQ